MKTSSALTFPVAGQSLPRRIVAVSLLAILAPLPAGAVQYIMAMTDAANST